MVKHIFLLLIFLWPTETLGNLTQTGLISVVKLVGFLGVFAFFVEELAIKKKSITFVLRNPIYKLLIFLFLFEMASLTWAANRHFPIRYLLTHLNLLMFVLIASVIFKNLADLENIILVLMLGVLVSDIYSLSHYSQLLDPGISDASARISGVATNPNILARNNVYIIPLAFYLFERLRSSPKNNLFTIAFPIIIAIAMTVTLLTSSRAGIIVLIFVVVALFIRKQPKRVSKHLLTTFVFSILLTGIAINYVKSDTLNIFFLRMQIILDPKYYDVSTQERALIYTTSFRIIKEHFLLGVGFRNFAFVLASMTPLWRFPHNVYLGYFAELGLIGISLMISIYIIVTRSFVKSMKYFIKNGFMREAELTRVFLICMIAQIIRGLVDSNTDDKVLWLTFAASIILHNLVKRYRAKFASPRGHR